MSSSIKDELQQLTNNELINFALEHLDEEHEAVRHLALEEHFRRIVNDPNTVIAPPGDIEILRAKVTSLLQTLESF